MRKRLWATLLALCIVVGLLPLSAVAAEEPTSGSCGESAVWTYDDSTKTLTISGEGDMSGTGQPFHPWSAYQHTIERVVIEDGITSISNHAFFKHENIVDVSIPESVTRMGEGAFWMCKNLSHIVIPASVTEFEDDRLMYEGGFGQPVFNGCNLTSAGPIGSGCSIEFGWTDAIPANALLCCPIESIIFPDGLRTIGEAAFAYNNNLTSITIPETVTSIDREAFFGCRTLEQLTIPASVIRINEDVFKNCIKLDRLYVAAENKIYSSQDGVLFNKEKTKLIWCPTTMTSYTVPQSVTELESSSFENCSELTSIELPDGLNIISGGAFKNCTSLTNVIIPNSVTQMGQIFDGCTALTDITLSGGISSYYGFDLSGSIKSNLSTVRISQGTTGLFRTFSGYTGLTTVYLPASITEIGEDTFKDCYNLEKIYYSGTQAQWNSINIAEGNQELSLATVVCTDTDIPGTPEKPVTAVSIPEAITFPVRTDYIIRPDVEPTDAIPRWTWTSADTGIAEVAGSEDGITCKVTGIAPGVTTITGTTQNGLTASSKVTITDAPEPVSATINPSYQIGVGGYVDIKPVLTPSNATTFYEATSDNSRVANISTAGDRSSIRIEGINSGTATITIRTCNGLVMTTKVTVGKTPSKPSEPSEPSKPGGSNTSGSSSGGSGYTGTTGGGSGGGSGGSSSGNRTQTVTANSQSIPATVKNGTAEVSATEKQLAAVLEQAAKEGVAAIDVSSIEEVSELSISQNMVKAVSESDDISSLSVRMQSGTIEMSSEALQTVSDALSGSRDYLSVKVDTVDINTIPATQKYPIAGVLNSAVFVELSAAVIHKNEAGRTLSTEPLHEFNGPVTVSVPYVRPANMEGRQIIACHIAGDGSITYFPVRYENGIATFTTSHFSVFAILESYAAAFRDIDIGAWYLSSVEYALQNSLMNGYDGRLFAPEGELSRAMLAQILYNKEGRPGVAASNPFTDVPAGAWYTDAVIWAAEYGIVDGYGNGAFGPDDPVTREQLAVMLWRYAGEPAASESKVTFSDADRIGGYAISALKWAVEKGIINGKDNGLLDPGGLATRAETAEILKNYLEE